MKSREIYEGPALFSYGFRPFFLFAGVFAVVVIPIWWLVWRGDVSISGHLASTDWHIHEMIFGYGAAVVAGFLFTAVPNWTGRMPTRGWPLVVLLALWLAGRASVAGLLPIGPVGAAITDQMFLLAVAGMIAREIVAGRNWKNLKVLVPVSLLWGANILFSRRGVDPGRVRHRPAAWYRPAYLPDHADRGAHRAKLHAELACPTQVRAVAGGVQSFRRCLHPDRSCRIDQLGHRAISYRERSCRRRCSFVAPDAAAALAGTGDLAIATPSDASRRIPDGAARLSFHRGRSGRSRWSGRQRACAGHRRRCRDDAGGHDAGNDGPYRPAIGCRTLADERICSDLWCDFGACCRPKCSA